MALIPVPTPASSGTTTFNLDLIEIIAEAFERCGILSLKALDYRTARRSLDLMMLDWGNRGINLWKVYAGTISLVAGTATYNLPQDTIDITDGVIRTYSGQQQQDYVITPISYSTYATIPNKLITGRPVEYYTNRQINPTVTLWPIPDATTSYTFAYWALTRIQDTGKPGSNTMDVPSRFLPCLTAGLAYMVGQKRPQNVPLDRLGQLKAAYDEAWQLAAGEDRTRASQRFVPYVPYIGGSN